MKASNVPQDDDQVLEGKFKVVKYAVDEQGEYTKVLTVGWEAENIVLKQTWEDLNDKAEDAKRKVVAGAWSPIGYFMVKQMMDFKMVSGYSGFNVFQVRLHRHPFFFNRLKNASLERYAKTFRVSIDELKNPFSHSTEG
jgi:hypothetical protein